MIIDTLPETRPTPRLFVNVTCPDCGRNWQMRQLDTAGNLECQCCMWHGTSERAQLLNDRWQYDPRTPEQRNLDAWQAEYCEDTRSLVLP